MISEKIENDLYFGPSSTGRSGAQEILVVETTHIPDLVVRNKYFSEDVQGITHATYTSLVRCKMYVGQC